MVRRVAASLFAVGVLVSSDISSGSSSGISSDRAASRQAAYRTLDDRFAPPGIANLDDWKRRANYLREHVLVSAGLMPMPEKTPLRAVVSGEISHPDYTVSRVYFESLPGFYVTGNLYRPSGAGPFPAVVSPHGHWTYGRLENTDTTSGPGRAIGLARQGIVAFTYDMIGYNDSQQLTHTFDGRRERLWGLSLAGLQLWNSIRAVDFLESLPYVTRDAIGATGESGGGTQTFLLAAVEPRIAVAAPVNMISLHMQGGCLCENPPALRLETTNVELAATIAPRPLLMVSATGDWTAETMEVEYPAVRKIYELFGAADRVHAVRVTADHNYNRESREAMYAWMARWLQNASGDIRRPEKSFSVEPLQNLLVFFQKPLPPGAVTPAQLTDNWIAGAQQQLTTAGAATRVPALLHVLGEGFSPAVYDRPPPHARRAVLLASADASLSSALSRAGLEVIPVNFTPFDKAAADKVRHFETYNRTAASQRVADIVAAIGRRTDAALVADGDAALAALLAVAVVNPASAVLDVGQFDTSNDDAYLDHLYIPGLRRAGDFETAMAAAAEPRTPIVVHNAGTTFKVKGLAAREAKLTAAEIVAMLRTRSPGASAPWPKRQ
jgi:dienelactone hydrolase